MLNVKVLTVEIVVGDVVEEIISVVLVVGTVLVETMTVVDVRVRGIVDFEYHESGLNYLAY